MFGTFLSTIVARTSGDPLALASILRKQVWAVDPNEPVLKMETMDDIISGSIWRPRFSAWVFSALGGIGAAANRGWNLRRGGVHHCSADQGGRDSRGAGGRATRYRWAW